MKVIVSYSKWGNSIEGEYNPELKEIRLNPDNELLYCPYCGWRGPGNDLDGKNCPECDLDYEELYDDEYLTSDFISQSPYLYNGKTGITYLLEMEHQK